MKPKNLGLSNAKIAIVVSLFWTLVLCAVFGWKLALALFIPAALFTFVMLCVITSGAKNERE